MKRSRLLVPAVHLLACVALANVHRAWMEEPRDPWRQLLATFMGPAPALNTHMSVVLFTPLFMATLIPLAAAAELKAEGRGVALLIFVVLWLKTGEFLAPLF